MNKEPIVTFILFVITIFLASSVFSSENFVLGTYNPVIDICKDEAIYDTILVYNTGTYLSDYKFTLDTPNLLSAAKISANSFSLYPGQNANVTIRFQMPKETKTGEYNFELSLITALENKKTLRYILNVKDCLISEYSSINTNYTVTACDSKTIPITLYNKKGETINFTSRYELPFAYMTKKVSMPKNSIYSYNITFLVPCEKNGTVYMQYNLTAGQIKKQTLIPVTIIPHTFHTISTEQKEYIICGNNKVSIPVKIVNNDNTMRTISLSLNKEVALLASLENSKITLNNSNKEKIVNINIRPILFPKDSRITITGTDEKGATYNTSFNLTFKSKAYCELPTTDIKNDSITINTGQSKNYIDISYNDVNGYNQVNNITYKISSSPWQSWVNISENKITLQKGETKRVYLNTNPTNKTVSRTYEFKILTEGEYSKNTKNINIIVENHKGQKYLGLDNIYYIVYQYKLFLIIGIIIGIIIVIILITTYNPKPKYRIIKRGDKVIKQTEKSIEKIEKISDERESLDNANDLDTLLGVIEVEKKAREKIITELESWSGQYEELQKERQKKDLRQLKSKQEILKDYKDINELLKIQKESYANLKKREDQMQNAINKRKDKKKKGFFANLFNVKKEEDFVSLDEVKKRGKKVKEEKIVERVKKTSKKDKNTVGNKLRQFFVDDDEE